MFHTSAQDITVHQSSYLEPQTILLILVSDAPGNISSFSNCLQGILHSRCLELLDIQALN